ncbi:hypothetical protein EV286_111152 [Rhizobium sp. BK251]|nr:hypothetical protein EV286_111152 [Rhizobium sp. BK251]
MLSEESVRRHGQPKRLVIDGSQTNREAIVVTQQAAFRIGLASELNWLALPRP